MNRILQRLSRLRHIAKRPSVGSQAERHKSNQESEYFRSQIRTNVGRKNTKNLCKSGTKGQNRINGQQERKQLFPLLLLINKPSRRGWQKGKRGCATSIAPNKFSGNGYGFITFFPPTM